MLQKEIDNIKGQVLSLSAKVEDMVERSVQAVSEQNAILAENVIQTDADVDELEVEIEEECLKVLALHQPVEKDLRIIIALLKINNDLERIGDLAVSIAKRARKLDRQPDVQVPRFADMVESVRKMLSMSLDSLVEMDANMARHVLKIDDEVDDINRRNFSTIKKKLKDRPDLTPTYLRTLTISKNLERIADLATNIAEDVIYLVDGEIVRHQHRADLPDR